MESFSVIEFTKDNSVAVVSSAWLDKDKINCRWPRNPGTKLNKLVIAHTLPAKDWTSHPCRVLKISSN